MNFVYLAMVFNMNILDERNLTIKRQFNGKRAYVEIERFLFYLLPYGMVYKRGSLLERRYVLWKSLSESRLSYGLL